MYAKSVLKAMLGDTTTGVIPIELIPVDRIMQRWDSAHRGGYPVEDYDPVSRPPPLDDDTCMVVDDIIRVTPPKSKRILVAWYRRPFPTKVIADQLGLSPRSLEKQWLLALHFLRYRFEVSRNLTLARLLRVRV